MYQINTAETLCETEVIGKACSKTMRSSFHAKYGGFLEDCTKIFYLDILGLTKLGTDRLCLVGSPFILGKAFGTPGEEIQVRIIPAVGKANS